MLINNYISGIACDCIRISYCDHYWRNRIRNGIWRCDCGNTRGVICN